jgi:hypothetical protein
MFDVMAALHITLDLAGQNTVSALSAHGQRVLSQMLKILTCNAALYYGTMR